MIGKIKDYFSFNKKERNGILLLSCLLLLLILYSQFSYLLQTTDKTDFTAFKKEIAALEYVTADEKKIKNEILFYFNPNTLNDKGWEQLGLSAAKIKTLRNYQNSGGYFNQKTDLLNCYAIEQEFYDKVKGFLRFPKVEQISAKELKVKKVVSVELNSADSLTLLVVKGIGPFYAKQILEYRKELGGFISYDQFNEIWGLEKLDISSLIEQTSLDTLLISKININNTSIDVLRKHPYINYKQAKMLVNYRAQHGDYKKLEDILKIKLISPEIFRKIAPYLTTYD